MNAKESRLLTNMTKHPDKMIIRVIKHPKHHHNP